MTGRELNLFTLSPEGEPNLILNSTGKNPCRPLAGIRDRGRRPCEGFSDASATQPVVSARAAFRDFRDADVRSASSEMTDMLCAMPRPGRASLSRGYAMIFRSSGRRTESLWLSRVAGHSNPMTGIHRSNLSCRTILFLIVLMGLPTAARSATLENSAKGLARKIDAALPPGDGASVEIRNLSTLTPSEIAIVKKTLDAELQIRESRTASNTVSIVEVLVTLSENVKGFVWSAEIRQGDHYRVAFVTLPKSTENQIAPRAKSLSLHAEKFWEGPERILDAAVAWIAEGNQRLVLLVPDGMLVRTFDGGSAIKIPIESFQTHTRNPEGTLLEPLSVLLEPNVCTVALNPPAVRECHHAPKLSALPSIPGHGQVTPIHSICGAGFQIMASGGGDDSLPDTVQAFEEQSGSFVAVSEELNFPGPVSLHNAPNMANPTAVVRNLQTGNYEAYGLSISCER